MSDQLTDIIIAAFHVTLYVAFLFMILGLRKSVKTWDVASERALARSREARDASGEASIAWKLNSRLADALSAACNAKTPEEFAEANERVKRILDERCGEGVPLN